MRHIAGRTAISLAALTAGISAAPIAANAQQDNASAVLQEVIVTAQKRTERLQDVPDAITAIKGQSLVEQGTNTLRDLVGFVPGLQLGGATGNGTPTIRGITAGSDVSPTVGIVVDGIPVGTSSAVSDGQSQFIEIDPYLLEQIEVLRGPQGTLYGASTLSGLISYTTKRPNLTTVSGSVYAEGSYTEHGDGSYNLRASGNIPLIDDKLAVQVSLFDRNLGGFIDDVANGRKDYNTSHDYGLRVAALLKINENLSVQLSGYTSYNHNTLDQLYYSLTTHKPISGDLKNDEYAPTESKNHSDLLMARVDYKLGSISLSSLTSYQHYNFAFPVDDAQGGLGPLALSYFPLFGGVTIPSPEVLVADPTDRVQKYTQEFRAVSPDRGQFRWIVGAYYTKETDDNEEYLYALQTSGAVAPGAGRLLDFRALEHYDEYAGYGNATYYLTPQLTITGGIRIAKIEQNYQQFSGGSDFAAYNDVFSLFGYTPTPAVTGVTKSEDTVETYLGDVTYHFDRQNMVFFRYATGYRPGGPNVFTIGLPPSYKPDKTTNFEIGYKTEFWSGRAQAEVEAYHIDWDSIQLETVANGVAGFTNGHSATSQGIEASGSLRPINGLTFGATVALNNANLNQQADPLGLNGLAHDRLPNAPKWSGSLSGQYTWPLTDSIKAFAGGNVRYDDTRFTNVEHALTSPQYKLPSYILADLNAGIQKGPVKLQAYIHNVADERAQLGAGTTSGTYVEIARPRTFGLSVQYDF